LRSIDYWDDRPSVVTVNMPGSHPDKVIAEHHFTFTISGVLTDARLAPWSKRVVMMRPNERSREDGRMGEC